MVFRTMTLPPILSRLPPEIIDHYASGTPLDNENFGRFPKVLEHAMEMRVHTMEVLGETEWLLREEEIFVYEHDDLQSPYHTALHNLTDMYEDCCVSEFIAIVFEPFRQFLGDWNDRNIGVLGDYFPTTGNEIVNLAHDLR